MNQLTISIDQWMWLIPFIFIGAYLGFMRGWREMAIFVAFVLAAVLVADAIQGQVPKVLERLVNIGRLVGPALTDTSPQTGVQAPNTPPPGWLQDPHNQPLIMMGLFIIMAMMAYVIGKAIGTRTNLGVLGRFFGGVFGAIAFTVILSKLLDYWQQYQIGQGNPAAQAGAATSPVATPQIVVPSVAVKVEGLPASNFLSTWTPWIVAAFFILILVYALLRVSRANE
jgi:uncharacterized membrane protein required for colicin V production